MKLLFSTGYNNASLNEFLSPGSYGAFFIVYEGANVALGNTTLDDLGSILFTVNNQPIINVSASFLNRLPNLYQGVSEFSNVVGGAVRASIFVNCGAPWDKNNVYAINPGDRVYWKLDFPALAALWASGTVKIYGIPKIGVQNYMLQIQSRFENPAGLSTLANNIVQENILSMYFDNATLLTRLQLTKDSNQVVDASRADLQAYSDTIHQVESATTLLAVEFAPTRDLKEALGRKVEYTYDASGAGSIPVYFTNVIWTPSKAIQTKQNVDQMIIQKVSEITNKPVVTAGNNQGISQGKPSVNTVISVAENAID